LDCAERPVGVAELGGAVMTDLKVVDGKYGDKVDERQAHFDRAYSEWLSANADMAKFNAGETSVRVEKIKKK
jgi:hypothetical protein